MPDLPGFGGSPLLPTPFPLEEVAQMVWRWADELEIAMPVLVGHSLGGYVALAMAALRPAAVDKLVLFHSTATADSDEKKANRTKVIDFVERLGPGPFLDNFVPGLFLDKSNPLLPEADRICRQTSKETLLAYTAAMRDRPDRIEFIQNWPRPMLFLAGQGDGIIPVETLEIQSKMAKKGSLAVVDGVGHLGMLEAPEKTAQLLMDFIG